MGYRIRGAGCRMQVQGELVMLKACRVARMGSWDYTEVLMRSRFGTVDDKN